MKDLKDVEVVIPTTFPFNSPFWNVQHSNGFWRMTVDYYKLSQAVRPISPAKTNVLTLIEKMNISPSTWYTAIDLTKTPFSISVNKYHHKFLLVGKATNTNTLMVYQIWFYVII